jgi:hypothetical protein
MNPYHYSVVRCRDAAVRGESRNIGLLVVSPALKKAWLRRGVLEQRAHLIGDEAAFVRALLDLLEEEAKEVAREGAVARVHDWLRGRARPTEDAVSLSLPAVGIAANLDAEVARLAHAYLGKAGRGSTSVEKLRSKVLRNRGLQRLFAPRKFDSGPAVWNFPFVADLANGRPLVFTALEFAQKKPERLLDAAFTNIGRVGEVALHHPGIEWLTVASGPNGGAAGRAFSRAIELMDDAGMHVVPPSLDQVDHVLATLDLLGRAGAVEAK